MKPRSPTLQQEQEYMRRYRELVANNANPDDVSEQADVSAVIMLVLGRFLVQQPGDINDLRKKVHLGLVELLPLLYFLVWTLLAAEISFLHADFLPPSPLPQQVKEFIPQLGHYDFGSNLGITPGCLAAHFTSVAASCLVASRVASQRLREWLYAYGPLEQWQAMYPKGEEFQDATYARFSKKETQKLLAPERKTLEICGFQLNSQAVALPHKSEVFLKLGIYGVLGLSMFGFLCVQEDLSGHLTRIREIVNTLADSQLSKTKSGMPKYQQTPSQDTYLMPNWPTQHPELYYLALWLPIFPLRLFNAILFGAECSFLAQTSERLFKKVGSGNEGRMQVKEQLDILKWKVQDISSDWSLMLKFGVVLDLMAVATGVLAAWRLSRRFDHDPSFDQYDEFNGLLVANCFTSLIVLTVQILPVITWNACLEKALKDSDNVDPVLHLWLSQGFLKMKVFGLALSWSYFVALAIAQLALMREPIQAIVVPPLMQTLD